MSDCNAKTIAEFRANEGRVGGVFEGAPMVLLHHRGRKSGRGGRRQYRTWSSGGRNTLSPTAPDG